MTNVFLGYPPEHIMKWIEEHSSNEPAGHEKTWIQFEGQENYQEFDWSGEITQQTMIDAGLYDGSKHSWTRNPVKIEIGTNVTCIGEYAFQGCGLSSITIPSSVTSIGNQAFYSCPSLTSVTIPDSVTSIGNYVFMFCSSLTSITIPDSVTSIGYGAFAECLGLTSITFNNTIETFKTEGEILIGVSDVEIYTPNCTIEEISNLYNLFSIGHTIHCSDGDFTVVSGK